MYQQIIISLTEGSTPERVCAHGNSWVIYKAGLHGQVRACLGRYLPTNKTFFSSGSSSIGTTGKTTNEDDKEFCEYFRKEFISGDFYLVAHKLFICHVEPHIIYLFQISSDFERSAIQ